MPEQPGIPLNEQSDEALVEAYRVRLQEEAFALLVARYKQELFRFLVKFTGKPAIADELFQEVFLQVHISIETFDTDRRFKPWLFTIAANKARDYLRKHVRKQAVSFSALSGKQEEDRSVVDLLEADIALPSDTADRHEIQEIVRRVVQDMPDHLREVLLLAYFEKLAYKEIAEMLEIPLGTVKSRLHTAVGTFATAWKAEYATLMDPDKGGSGEDGQETDS